MNKETLERISEFVWRIPATGRMCVPAIVYADDTLIREMDDKVFEQACNVASLPGIVGASYAMPDAHWGYGFPIGGVAAFDPDHGGIVSAGGVGFDISCGVRTLLTGLTRDEVGPVRHALADALYEEIPAGVGSRGGIRLNAKAMDRMLAGGAVWAVDQGWGEKADLAHIEEGGCMEHARPGEVSSKAKERQREEMGTLGSGNHYLEVQEVAELYESVIAARYGLRQGSVVIGIHCGSRGLGHQIGTEFLRSMQAAAVEAGIALPDRELACAPIESAVGRSYLGAMRAAINCALANRQVLTHLTRQVFARFFPNARLSLLFDVSHNTCKLEEHPVEGRRRRLYVHRKGATRAFGPGHPALPAAYRETGQPVLIGGSMGTSSYILAGVAGNEDLSYSSACHGAGRSMSRHQATRTWKGRQVIDDLAGQGILIRSPSQRGVAEEAPGAYKDVDRVVQVAARAGLARLVARLRPMICVKG